MAETSETRSFYLMCQVLLLVPFRLSQRDARRCLSQATVGGGLNQFFSSFERICIFFKLGQNSLHRKIARLSESCIVHPSRCAKACHQNRLDLLFLSRSADRRSLNIYPPPHRYDTTWRFAKPYYALQVLDQMASVAYTKCCMELGMEVRTDCSNIVAGYGL